MAYRSFTNLSINDKQFDALNLPPKAPSSTNHFRSNDYEGHEILFHASNVLNAHENPTLAFLGDEEVHGPTNSPNTSIRDLGQSHATESKIDSKMKRTQVNRVYSARYRQKKIAKLQDLENRAKSLEERVSTIQHELVHWGSTRDKLVEENTIMKAHYEAAKVVKAEKEAETLALMQELKILRNNY